MVEPEAAETEEAEEEAVVNNPKTNNLAIKLDPEVPGIRTSQQVRLATAVCISGGAGEPFSAQIQDPAHGRTSSPLNLQNETKTSSAKVIKIHH